jgi:hypothetical protein
MLRVSAELLESISEWETIVSSCDFEQNREENANDFVNYVVVE